MKCGKCVHYSETIAKVESGIVVSMCCNPESPNNGTYQPKWGGCDHFEDGMPFDLDRVPAGQRERSVLHRQRMRDDIDGEVET